MVSGKIVKVKLCPQAETVEERKGLVGMATERRYQQLPLFNTGGN